MRPIGGQGRPPPLDPKGAQKNNMLGDSEREADNQRVLFAFFWRESNGASVRNAERSDSRRANMRSQFTRRSFLVGMSSAGLAATGGAAYSRFWESQWLHLSRWRVAVAQPAGPVRAVRI